MSKALEAETPAALAAMERAFHLASANGPDRTVTYSIAGHRIVLRIVGAELGERIAETLSHLEVADSGPVDLAVHAWDPLATGVPPPDGVDEIDPGSRFPYAVVGGDRFVAHRWPHTYAWLDRRRSRLFACAEGARLSSFERGRPLEPLLLVWLRDQGLLLLHAAMVSLSGRGLVLVGASGAGKSTTALASALDGFDYLGDDKIAVAQHSAHFLGASLNGSLFVDEEQLRYFPAIADFAIAAGDGSGEPKHLVPLARSSKVRLAASSKIAGLVLPRTGADAARIAPASPRDGLLACALSTSFALPIDRRTLMPRLAALASALPTYSLDLAADPRQAPGQLRSVLRAIERS